MGKSHKYFVLKNIMKKVVRDLSNSECKDCTYYDAAEQCKIGIHSDRVHLFPRDIPSFSFEGSSLAPYVPTPCNVVHRMLSLAELKTGETVYDLGSGDGRIVMLAAGNFGAQAVGFECEKDLVKKSLERIHKFHFDYEVKIIKDDLLNVDIDKADVVTMYLSPGGNEKVKLKLERELKSGARVISLEFEIQGWKIHKVDQIVDEGLTYTIYVYNR